MEYNKPPKNRYGKPVELRPYQRAVFDEIQKNSWPWPSLRFGRHPYTVGIDMGSSEGDRTVIAHALRGRKGITKIWFDEYADLPDFKWYRNPIKWWKFKKALKVLDPSHNNVLHSNNKRKLKE